MGVIRLSRYRNCGAQFFPREGHLLVVDRIAEILDEFRGESSIG
jgi:hypothetical protein